MKAKGKKDKNGPDAGAERRTAERPAPQQGPPAVSGDGGTAAVSPREAEVQPRGPLAVLLAETKEALAERVLRLQADLENLRKRTLREKEELGRRANEQLIAELLPVLDHMDMAIRAGADKDAAVVQGVGLVRDQFLDVLRKFGLISFDATGQPFDPQIHEAISYVPSAQVAEGKVLAEVRKGYFLGGRLLRPARVVVSSGKPATTGGSANVAGGAQGSVETVQG